MTYPIGIANWMDLLNSMIDDRIKEFGRVNTIVYLLKKGVDPKVLVERLSFNKDDVIGVIKYNLDVNDYIDFIEGGSN